MGGVGGAERAEGSSDPQESWGGWACSGSFHELLFVTLLIPVPAATEGFLLSAHPSVTGRDSAQSLRTPAGLEGSCSGP